MGPMGERGLAAAFSSTSIIAAKKAIVKEFEEHMSMGELKAKRGVCMLETTADIN